MVLQHAGAKRNAQSIRHASRRLRPHVLLLCALALCVTAQAQSGRRVSTPKNDPPVPAPAATPQPPEPKPEERKKIPLLVLFDNAPAFQFSVTLFDTVKEVFGRRLRDAQALDATAEVTKRGRGEASKRAKAEKERHIVWVALVADSSYSGPVITGRPRTDDVRIEYAIYEPGTGKTVAYGNVYPRPSRVRVGRAGVPACYPAVYVYDYEFVEAAIEAADRVIKEFNLPLPPVCS